MTAGTVIVRGVVHGKTIELEHETGIPEGLVVSVTLRAAFPPGQGIKKAFGSWAAEHDKLDEFIAGIYADRAEGRIEAHG